MKKVWLSSAIAIIIVLASVAYGYSQKRNLDKLKASISEAILPVRPPSVVTKEYSDTTLEYTASSPDNSSQLEVHLLDEECCPEDDSVSEDLVEVLETFAVTTDDPLSAETSETRDGKAALPPDASLRVLLAKEYGDTPDIDLYIDLLRKLRERADLTFEDMLLHAELEARYNPSSDADKLFGLLTSIANDPEKDVVGFNIEYLPLE